MTMVYGPGVEPGGMELDDQHETVPCPKCSAPAYSWYCERAEDGSLNTYAGLSCETCGFEEGDRPDTQP